MNTKLRPQLQETEKCMLQPTFGSLPTTNFSSHHTLRSCCKIRYIILHKMRFSSKLGVECYCKLFDSFFDICFVFQSSIICSARCILFKKQQIHNQASSQFLGVSIKFCFRCSQLPFKKNSRLQPNQSPNTIPSYRTHSKVNARHFLNMMRLMTQQRKQSLKAELRNNHIRLLIEIEC